MTSLSSVSGEQGRQSTKSDFYCVTSSCRPLLKRSIMVSSFTSLLWGHKVFTLLWHRYYAPGWSHGKDVVPAPCHIYSHLGPKVPGTSRHHTSSTYIVLRFTLTITLSTLKQKPNKKHPTEEVVKEPLKNILTYHPWQERQAKARSWAGIAAYPTTTTMLTG